MILCVYCFIGLLASMFYFMKFLSETADKSFDFNIAIILGFTSVIAGMYIKIIGDMESSYVITEYINSVPDDRKEFARSCFK